MNASPAAQDIPLIGILGWEAGNEDTLSQLEDIPGNIAHPDTFPFPVLYRRVTGTCYRTIVEEPGIDALEAMIEAAREIEGLGVRAITTSCGFNAIFQKRLARAVGVPLFASSLLQVPMAHRMLRESQPIGIMTADRAHLTREHLEEVGISPDIPVCIRGIEETEEFSRTRRDPSRPVDPLKFGREVLGVARALVDENRDMGAIVLECTDLPPFASDIRRATGLPVFDIVTLTTFVYRSLAGC